MLTFRKIAEAAVTLVVVMSAMVGGVLLTGTAIGGMVAGGFAMWCLS